MEAVPFLPDCAAAKKQQRGKEDRADRHIFQIRAGIKTRKHPQNPEHRLFLRVAFKKADIRREKRQPDGAAPAVVARPVQPEKHLSERRDKHPHSAEDHKEDEVIRPLLRLRETGKECNQRREYQSVYNIKYPFGQQQKKLRAEMGEQPSVHGLRVRRHRREYLAEAHKPLSGRKAVHVCPVVHRIRREGVSEKQEKKSSEKQRRAHLPGADRRHGQRLLAWDSFPIYYTQAENEVKLRRIFLKTPLTIPPGGI